MNDCNDCLASIVCVMFFFWVRTSASASVRGCTYKYNSCVKYVGNKDYMAQWRDDLKNFYQKQLVCDERATRIGRMLYYYDCDQLVSDKRHEQSVD